MTSPPEPPRPFNFKIEHRGDGRYDWYFTSVHGTRAATETEIVLWQEIERIREQMVQLVDLSNSDLWPSRMGREPMTEDEFFWIVNGYSRQITELMALNRETTAEWARLGAEVELLTRAADVLKEDLLACQGELNY